MKAKVVSGLIILFSLMMVTGCSFNVSKLKSFNPLAKKADTVKTEVYENKTTPVKSQQQLAQEIVVKVDQMVEKVNSGKWGEAIIVGEAAHETLNQWEEGKKKTASNDKNNKTVPLPQASSVEDEVYGISMETVKERLYDTLIDAYDFKNHLEGLNKDEKEKYIKVARNHLAIKPDDPLKKHALAKVLLDTGNYTEGFKIASELYNSPAKNWDMTETYAWGLYLTGKKNDSYEIYKTFLAQATVWNLVQGYHSAVILEEFDKLFGLSLYKGCEEAANNLLVLEQNVNNYSAQSYINKIKSDSKKAVDRLLIGGLGVDSQYNYQVTEKLIHSIVDL